MVDVFFICSSPYVGYTLRKADYIQKKMLPCSGQDMTALGYKVFNNSGSYMVLTTFEGKRYFHTRQSFSEHYDEQGRRIYANIAFLGGNARDTETINAIAAYTFFEEDAFYAEMADMIKLLDDGFTIDFNRLSAFLKRFEKKCVVEPRSAEAERAWQAITGGFGRKELDLIVRESTWNYFVKQIGYGFHDSVGVQLSYAEAKALSGKAAIRFGEAAASEEKKVPAEVPVKAEKEKEVLLAPEEKGTDGIQEKDTCSEKPQQMDEEAFGALRQENETQKKLLEAADQKIASFMKEIASFQEKLRRHFLLGLLVGIVGTAIAVLLIRVLF